jgi:hypothetical protein
MTAHDVIELRQYGCLPGRRDELTRLFDRELVESQEEQFRDREDSDRFVWLRSFLDLATRRAALEAFHGGPGWARHRGAANATMKTWDDVLLVRPAGPTPRLLSADRLLHRPRRAPAGRGGPHRVGSAADAGGGERPSGVARSRGGARAPSDRALRHPEHHAAHLERLAAHEEWHEGMAELSTRRARPDQYLRLCPTPRSMLR